MSVIPQNKQVFWALDIWYFIIYFLKMSPVYSKGREYPWNLETMDKMVSILSINLLKIEYTNVHHIKIKMCRAHYIKPIST